MSVRAAGRIGSRRSAALFFLIATLFGGAAALGQEGEPGQEDPTVNPAPRKRSVPARVWRVMREEARRYGRDSVAVLKAPLVWKKRDWEKAGGAVLILGGLMLADRSIDSAAQRQRSNFTDRVAGALLGTAIGHFLVHRHHQEEAGVLSKAELEIVPIQGGLAARVRF